ncbi:MAG: polyphosphate polymerase domain-containing protein, partial [Lachnospiraceae bacterium]|nr:polyphosphate polymerase domain-containing protein [Lachnospiraceae bacterium]
MGDQMIFKRYEMKYLISTDQLALIKEAFQDHMIADIHGKNTICSLYYDTPDYRLIRRSLEKPVYKEKLRVRSYGVADSDTFVFVELKKKYKSVVYKRRIGLSEKDAMHYLATKETPIHNQITNEIDYAMDFYKELAPAMLLTYEREAYYAKDNHEFRVTFDTNVLWRDYDLSLTKGIYGTPILTPDKVLMEVKTADSVP